MTERESMIRPGTTKAAGRATPGHAEPPPHSWARIAAAGCRCGPADRHRGDPSRPVPDRLPDDPHDRLAVPAPGDRGLRPGAGGTGHPRPARPARAGWPPRPEPASPSPPSAGTSCRSGSGCSGSRRSARPPASSPASWRWPPSRSWPRLRLLPLRRRPRRTPRRGPRLHSRPGSPRRPPGRPQ